MPKMLSKKLLNSFFLRFFYMYNDKKLENDNK